MVTAQPPCCHTPSVPSGRHHQPITPTRGIYLVTTFLLTRCSGSYHQSINAPRVKGNMATIPAQAVTLYPLSPLLGLCPEL